jgi:hypothetical protein
MSADRKTPIWCVMSFLFLRSMRGSEILATDRVKFDPVKTLCGEDLKMTVVKAQATKDLMIQPSPGGGAACYVWVALPCPGLEELEA